MYRYHNSVTDFPDPLLFFQARVEQLERVPNPLLFIQAYVAQLKEQPIELQINNLSALSCIVEQGSVQSDSLLVLKEKILLWLHRTRCDCRNSNLVGRSAVMRHVYSARMTSCSVSVHVPDFPVLQSPEVACLSR